MSDLVFRIAADLGDLKAALADVRRQIAEASAGGGKAFTPVNQQLDENAAKARIAAREAEKLARAQETAAQRAARAQERAAQQAEAAQKRAAARAAAEAERIAKQKERDAQRAAESVQRQETAKQRALAPQLTDITVGLATGQSPLMVLLQQGGQLKDLFGGIGPAVARVRARVSPFLRIEVEAESLAQVEEALAAGVDVIMLDNMPLALVKEAVALIGGRALTEVSGNVTLERVAELAATGVDFISSGALTHSARAADISMRLR